MQVITKNENKILLLIKNNLDKYPEKIPYNKIKDILELSETSLIDLLEALQEKNFIKLDSDAKEVHYIDLYLETKVVEDKSALKNGYAPRYVLEGALLYGELELSPKRTYNITVSLENKNLLKKVKRADGEYYTI